MKHTSALIKVVVIIFIIFVITNLQSPWKGTENEKDFVPVSLSLPSTTTILEDESSKSDGFPKASSEQSWAKGIELEINFWKKWLTSGGGQWQEEFKSRQDPNTRFDHAESLIKNKKVGQTHFIVLDVGAGPLTSFGKKLPEGYELELIPTDPLGALYDRALAETNMIPLVRTRTMKGEDISSVFAPGFFDMSCSRNALDHVMDPMKVIESMVFVTRVNGEVILHGNTNEAIGENYAGFHQWNFANLNGRLVIHNHNTKKPIDVEKELSKKYTVQVKCNVDSARFGITKQGYLRVSIMKLK